MTDGALKMYVKDELTFELFKKTLEEAHEDGEHLNLTIEGHCLRKECYFKPTEQKYYRYYNIPFNVADLDNEEFTNENIDILGKSSVLQSFETEQREFKQMKERQKTSKTERDEPLKKFGNPDFKVALGIMLFVALIIFLACHY